MPVLVLCLEIHLHYAGLSFTVNIVHVILNMAYSYLQTTKIAVFTFSSMLHITSDLF